MAVPVPDNEEGRLAALLRYRILDTPAEGCFDRLTALAAQFFQTPVAQLNFVDATRVWSKCSLGLAVQSVPREQSFCAHTILADGPMIVPDLSADSRFFDSPLVSGPPELRFYAGAALRTPSGYPVGSICVLDTAPHRERDRSLPEVLLRVAEIAVDELEQRAAALGQGREIPGWRGGIFDSAAIALAVTTTAGLYADMNAEFCALTGFTESELAGQPFSTVIASGARNRAARMHEAAAAGRPASTAATLVQRKDGRRLHVYVVQARMPAPHDAYCLSALIDVSELKQAEEQIRRIQKLDAVRRLAGGVAHNINNLLTIVIGYGQILVESLDESDSRWRYCEEITNAAGRVALVTGQLLTFSKHGVVSPRLIDINEAIRGAEGELREVLGNDIVYCAVLSPTAGKIRIGPGQLEQALRNLALNSREAMPTGGSFVLETTEVELDEDYVQLHPGLKPGKYSMITATDTGCGMDEETRNHLFEPYFTSKGVGKGTGLPVVYGIMSQAGGDLAIYSEPGGGTTIGLFFPKEEEFAANERSKGEGKLLLVEDQPEVLRAIREVLDSMGHPALTAGSAEEALRIWAERKNEIRAVIADIVLPRKTGPELAEALLAERPGLPVLYLSGYSEHVLAGVKGAARKGVFLQKPFTPGALREKLDELLQRDSAVKGQSDFTK